MKYFEDIEEKKFRLKYFYFIDTDYVKEKILDEISKNPGNYSSLTEKLLFIFSEIVSVARPYCEYILAYDKILAPSFFGEDLNIPEVDQSFLLSGISLFHHCIIYGFTKTLYTKATTAKTTKSTSKELLNYVSPYPQIKLSASTENSINLGFKYCLEHEISHDTIPAGDGAHKRFNKMCKDLRDKESSYSFKFIDSINTVHLLTDTSLGNKIKEKDPLFYLFKHQSSGGLFLIQTDEVRNFNRALEQSLDKVDGYKTLIPKYNDLFHTATLQKHSTAEDAIFFHTVLDKAYGFSFFPYLMNNYRELQTNKHTELLFGKIFTSLIADVAAKLPIEYNKSIFLKYALNSLTHSSRLTPSYPRKGEYGISYDHQYEKSVNVWATDAQAQLNEFYSTLNYVTIPLLEDIWTVLAHDIITLEEYSAFISEHFDTISLDFTTLPVFDSVKKRKATNYPDFYAELVAYTSTSKSPQETYDFQNIDDIQKNFLTELLQKYCTIIPTTTSADLISSFPARHTGVSRCYDNQNRFMNQHIKALVNFSSHINRSSL